MSKLEALFAVVVGLALVVLLTWGIATAMKDLTHVIEIGVNNIYATVE